MNPLKLHFIEMAIQHQVLKFGEFTLKSGRISPYFFNAGELYYGKTLQQIGHYYAKSIVDSQLPFEHLFGPAYKGLPLATATAIGLYELGYNKTVTFNRKEAKDHGEGGVLMGAPLRGRTIIIDDVISAGTAFRESKHLIESNGASVSAVMIALDRCERGAGHLSTIQDIESQGIQVLSLITLYDLLDYLKQENNLIFIRRIEQYLSEYGVSNNASKQG